MSISLEIDNLLDRSSESYIATFNGPILRNQKTLNGWNEFRITHEEMVKNWNAVNDYELGILAKGICKTCCCYLRQIHQEKSVLTQVGAARFGLNVGSCFACINEFIIQKDKLTFTVPFQNSTDTHIISISLNLIKNLIEREKPIGTHETEQPLSELHQSVLKIILNKNIPLLERALKEQEKEKLCKKCSKLKIDEFTLEAVNGMRADKKIAGCCVSCGRGYRLDGGCSIGTCTFCISSPKTCMVCVEGASGLTHDLVGCSDKMHQLLKDTSNADPLPALMICSCPDC